MLSDELFQSLCNEVDRLIDLYPDAIEPLEQIKWWGQEENVQDYN